MRAFPVFLFLAFSMAVCGCVDNPYASAPAPDYRIGLVKERDGKYIAVPPVCPDWRFYNPGPFQNEPWPQYGCAHARNLAAMVERPEDLEKGREISPALGSSAATAMRRYNQEKTKPLIDPNAKAPVADPGAPMGQDSEGTGGQTK